MEGKFGNLRESPEAQRKLPQLEQLCHVQLCPAMGGQASWIPAGLSRSGFAQGMTMASEPDGQ